MNPDTFASDLLGYSAAVAVLLTFLAQQLHTLRALAIASNLLFIAYALVAWLPPVLALHLLLLPINAWRLWQATRAPEPAPVRCEPVLVLPAPTLASFHAGTPPIAPAARRTSTDGHPSSDRGGGDFYATSAGPRAFDSHAT
jgi:hypothetical protein